MAPRSVKSDVPVTTIKDEGPLSCKTCNIQFHTVEARDTHAKQYHQLLQKQTCKGCGKEFSSAGAVVGHLESNTCPYLKNEDLDRARQTKIDWVRKLNSLDTAALSGNPIGQIKHNGDFGDYVNIPGEVPDELQRLSRLALEQGPKKPSEPLPAATDQSRAAYQHGDSKQQDFLGLTAENLASLDQGGNPWETSKTLFPDDTPAPSSPSSEKQESVVKQQTTADHPPAVAPTTKAVTSAAVHQPAPTHESFQSSSPLARMELNPKAHWVAVLERYKCPIENCNKSFPTEDGFTAHVYSSAHGNQTYICGCHKRFKSKMALTQHLQSPSPRCNVQNTSNFGQYFDQVAGGLVEAPGSLEEARGRSTPSRPPVW